MTSARPRLPNFEAQAAESWLPTKPAIEEVLMSDPLPAVRIARGHPLSTDPTS